MEIPTYQIHAVLSSLSRRLDCRSGAEGTGGGGNTKDRRFQGIIERVSRNIIERITEAGLNRGKNGAWEHLQSGHSHSRKPLLFKYTILDPGGRRRRHSIPIEAASLLPEIRTGRVNRGSHGDP